MVNRFVFILFLLLCSSGWAANTGEKSPASSAQEASPATAWTNIDSVFASDDQRASYTGTGKDSLYITGFNMGIPTDAIIDSIFVSGEGQGAASQAQRRKCQGFLVKDGKVAVGEQFSFDHDRNSDTQGRQTGETTPLFNTTWTAAEVNASTFGIVVWKQATQAGTILMDYYTIYIAYTESGGNGGTLADRRNRVLRSK